MPQSSPRIVVKYDFGHPFDLLDLTASLTAFGEQFRRMAPGVEEGGDIVGPGLQVAKLRDGSIIAELIPYAEQIDWLLNNRTFVAGFMAQWHEILQQILNLTPESKQLDKATVKAANAFVAPVAKDSAAQVNLAANDGGTILFAQTINYYEAGTIQNNARHLLRHDIPTEQHFESEPMILYQVRDAKGPSGDMGIIDRFGDRPAKLTWATDEAKAAILDAPENPFDLVFFVDGMAKTAGGRIVSYHVLKVNGTTAK